MNIFRCEENTGLGLAASSWCREKIANLKARSMFIPAGRTPECLYRVWESERPAYLDGVELIQIDDVLTGVQKGVFKKFFDEHLPTYAARVRAIHDGCARADIAVLGLGLNGHVAFHEPGLDRSFYSGCVRLSETTCGHLGLEPGTWGISYGAGAFSACKAILMMVGGASKREILQRLLDADPTLPASALLQHPGFTIIADREALPGEQRRTQNWTEGLSANVAY